MFKILSFLTLLVFSKNIFAYLPTPEELLRSLKEAHSFSKGSLTGQEAALNFSIHQKEVVFECNPKKPLGLSLNAGEFPSPSTFFAQIFAYTLTQTDKIFFQFLQTFNNDLKTNAVLLNKEKWGLYQQHRDSILNKKKSPFEAESQKTREWLLYQLRSSMYEQDSSVSLLWHSTGPAYRLKIKNVELLWDASNFKLIKAILFKEEIAKIRFEIEWNEDFSFPKTWNITPESLATVKITLSPHLLSETKPVNCLPFLL